MFFKYLIEICGFGFYDRIAIFDYKDIVKDSYLKKAATDFNYKILHYKDIEKFRYIYETKIKTNKDKYILVLKEDIYLPFDIRKSFYCRDINYKDLFPKLNAFTLENSYIFDLELLYIAYRNLYKTLDLEQETSKFLSDGQFEESNIKEYMEYLWDKIRNLMKEDGYSEWTEIALLYAKLEYIRYRCNKCISKKKTLDNEIQDKFKKFILNNYSTLSGYSSHEGPILLSKTLDYILMNSEKPALIVFDGMSIMDWLIIVSDLKEIDYTYKGIFALIPTITSISRQSLLSGKLPVQLENPFNLSKEKSLFIEKCKESGFREGEIKYHRGYDIDIDYLDKCICIIINDIDDLIHSQKQGNQGMYNDIKLLLESGKILKLIKYLQENGFDIYITSDHGHVETTTIGNPKGIGVELETKSKRALILKDFADYEKIIEDFEMIDYPPYYLPKDYKYLLCQYNSSLGIKEFTSVSHGGISIEEVIVPFIKIEGVEK